MKKELEKIEKYLLKMKASAEANHKNVIRKDAKNYYEGMIKAFDYALQKVRFYQPTRKCQWCNEPLRKSEDLLCQACSYQQAFGK